MKSSLCIPIIGYLNQLNFIYLFFSFVFIFFSTAIGQSVKDELRAQESIFSLEIRKISEERDRAVRDVNVQKTFVDEASERVNDLDATCRELRLQLEMQSSQHSESLARIAKEQEHVKSSYLRMKYLCVVSF